MSSEVSSISVYNRYTPPAWATRPVSAPTRRSPGAQPRQQPRRETPANPAGPRRPSAHPGLAPNRLDTGDLFLAAMLLFLYSESHDEDFLIILIVVGLSIFQK